MDNRQTKTTLQIELSGGVDCSINASEDGVAMQMNDGKSGDPISYVELSEDDTREIIYALRKAMYDMGWSPTAKSGDEEEQPSSKAIGFMRRGRRR